MNLKAMLQKLMDVQLAAWMMIVNFDCHLYLKNKMVKPRR